LNRLDLRHGAIAGKNMSSHLSALPDSLLLDLYAGAAEPARWPRALDQICVQTGACAATAIAFSYDNGRPRVHWKAIDSRTARMQIPAACIALKDTSPRLELRRVPRGLNRIVGDEELFDPGEEALRRLQQQMAALGLGRFVRALQEVSPGVFLALGLLRPLNDRLDFSASQLASVAALAPHLGQAFVLTDRLQASAVPDPHLREHLDRLRCGMVFCDAEGRVDWLNRSAERLLADGPLHLAGSRLSVDTEADTTKLMNELAQAGSAGGNSVRYVCLGKGELTLHVAIQAADDPSTFVLTLTSPSRGADIPTDALIELFGLTPTEALLVAALATGSTLEQYAKKRGVAVGTARVQLGTITAKTGVRRQADLVRLVWSSAVAHLSSGFDDPAEPPIPHGTKLESSRLPTVD
jgi:DNA-binding CsgD family transcriptional regulator/PAS domain-containing protein